VDILVALPTTTTIGGMLSTVEVVTVAALILKYRVMIMDMVLTQLELRLVTITKAIILEWLLELSGLHVGT